MDRGEPRDDGAEDDGETPDLDALHQLRLLGVLRDLVRNHSRAEAAEMLGIGRKTIWRGMTSGRLTPLLAIALEQWVVETDRAALTALEKHVAALDGQVEALQASVGALQGQVTALREAPAPSAPPHDEERMSQKRPTPAREQRPAVDTVTRPPWRPYSQLVTSEPEPGEELVYGEAMTNVAAWRTARRTAREGERRLERLDAELRMRELELVLIGDHELTLPPAVYPWSRADRRSELWRRQQALADVREERRRAVTLRWLLRLLTLGLWWK